MKRSAYFRFLAWATVAVVLATLRVRLLPITPPLAETLTWFNVYKDTAHIFIGGVFVEACHTKRWEMWAVFMGLNAVEIICALIGLK